MSDEDTKGADAVKAANADKASRPGGSNTDPQESKSTGDARTLKDVNINDEKLPNGNAPQPDTEGLAPGEKHGGVTSNDASSRHAVEQQHAKLDAHKDRVNAHNEAGHAKNMERLEKAGESAQKNTEAAKPTKKQDNGNTPIIDPKTGAKSWGPPQVA
jgi:hypothetical protein